MTEQPEYIVTEEQLDNIEWEAPERILNTCQAIRSRPHPAPEHRTYESCHKHFSCPDGEECWYWSADYYWDCGNGSARLIEGRIEAARKAREDFADKVIAFCKSNDCVQSTYGNCDCVSTTDIECVICFVESLRTAQSEQAGEP